mgnify:CR=1 FL=1
MKAEINCNDSASDRGGSAERGGVIMPWCPKCKNEYVDGVKTCVDCGCDLVGSLEEMEKEG